MNAATLILCAAFAALPASAAQFVEVEADLNVTQWQYQEDIGLPLKTTLSYPIHCVAGTNLWLVENQARTNVLESSWFVNGRIIRVLNTARDNMASDEVTYVPSRRGSRSASILPAPEGYPGSDLPVNVPWFAFCSGPFLRHSARGVPLPTSAPDRMAFGFTNETTFFPDAFRLPRRAEFFVGRQTKCLYQVQQSTNVLGWSIPLAFTVTHNEPDRFGKWNRHLTVTSRVTSVRSAPGFVVPKELLDLLELREQTSPVRRR